MRNSKYVILAATLSAAMLGGLSSQALAVNEINVAPGRTALGPGIGVHGYDTVAYFTEQKPRHGSAEHSAVHNGVTYRFASTANKKAFQANPEKYAPAFGGFCAYGVSVGAKFDGDPRYWKIVDGKLYVVLNKQIYTIWLKDVPGNIAKARKNWTKIKHSDPAMLP